MVSAASRIICWPTRVEPVSDTLRTARRGHDRRVGRPRRPDDEVDGAVRQVAGAAAVDHHHRRRPASGSTAATITEQPAASAGAILRASSAAGKFQAVKAATMPIGSRGHLEATAGHAALDDAAVDAPRLLGVPAELVARRGPTRARPGRSACRSRSRSSAPPRPCGGSSRRRWRAARRRARRPSSPARRRARARPLSIAASVSARVATGASPSGFSVTGLMTGAVPPSDAPAPACRR